MGHGVCAQVLAEAVQGPVCPEVFFMRWAGFGDCRPPCRSVWVGQDPLSWSILLEHSSLMKAFV